MSESAKWKRLCWAVDAVVGTAALLVFDLLFASIAGILIGTIGSHGLIKGAIPIGFGVGILLICVLFARSVIAAFLNWIKPEQSDRLARRRIVCSALAFTICISAALIGGIAPPTQNVLILAAGIAAATFVALAISRLSFGVVGRLDDRQ